jgi:hypothetical protein
VGIQDTFRELIDKEAREILQELELAYELEECSTGNLTNMDIDGFLSSYMRATCLTSKMEAYLALFPNDDHIKVNYDIMEQLNEEYRDTLNKFIQRLRDKANPEIGD